MGHWYSVERVQLPRSHIPPRTFRTRICISWIMMLMADQFEDLTDVPRTPEGERDSCQFDRH